MNKFKQVVSIAGMVITLMSALLPIINQGVDIVDKAKGLKEGTN